MGPSKRLRSLLWTSLLAIAGCAPTASPAESTTQTAVTETSSPPVVQSAPADYVVFAPRAFSEELAPLLELRKKQGHTVALRAVEDVYAARSGGVPKAEALRDEIDAMASSSSPSKLKFVLLAGDPKEGPAVVPSFYETSGADWIPAGFEAKPHRTDLGFSRFDKEPLAVGRLPARTEKEMTAMVDKILAYEGAASGGAWQKKVLVFGGPADFGPVADGLLESQATSILDQLLPYDYDVGVIFAKADSPYVYRYDQLGTKIVDEMNAGSLLAVYAGHGLEDSFDRARYRNRRYPIGTVREIEQLNITHGSPIFVSLTCLTGDYGMPNGQRSIAETMVLNPRGPVAVFASSDISHPYPNLLYAQSLLDSFILKRSPTVGEGIVAAKKDMLTRSIPFASLIVPGDLEAIKKEHLGLYNLLGDPATQVRLPAPLTVKTDEASVHPKQLVHVKIDSPLVGDAPVRVTIETDRSTVKPGMVPPAKLEEMSIESAFEAMAKNFAIASDKVLVAKEGAVKGGKSEIEIAAPDAPGTYFVKVMAQSPKGIAAGHARIEVK